MGQGYSCEGVWIGQTGRRGEEWKLTGSKVGALGEVVRMSVGWKKFALIESAKEWLWYGTVSRRNWKGWMEECRWGINGSNTNRVVYEPWMDPQGCIVDSRSEYGGPAHGEGLGVWQV